MKQYRFGIDIDGTVTCPSTLIPHINKRFQTNITLADVTEYSFLSAFKQPVDKEEFNSWFKANENAMYAVSDLAVGAKETLLQWQPNYELFYISARGEQNRDVTLEWFKQQQLPYDEITLIGTHHKIEAAKQANVQLFLEDKHDNAVDISEALDIPVLLFNTPYNQLPIPHNVIRVNDWYEANAWVRANFK